MRKLISLVLVFAVLAFVLLGVSAQNSEPDMSTHTFDTPVLAEGLTLTVGGPNEIPPGAIYLGRDMDFEMSLSEYWVDADTTYAFRTFLNPHAGVLHLRQWLEGSLPYQSIDISDCSPIHPIWFYVNVAITSGMPPENDIQQGIVFNGLTGLSIATLWTRWNHDMPGDGEYDEIRVRVDGVPQVAQVIWFAIGTSFGLASQPHYTKFDTDAITIACLPIGWTPSPEYKVYGPILLRNWPSE